MDKIIRLHRRIAPELIDLLEERYNILRHIQYSQPVGRRALAGFLGVGERIVRAQVDFLKDAGLLDFSPLGMTVTKEGEAVLNELADYVRQLHGLTTLENELAAKLGLRSVVIIPGDSDSDTTVLRELGRAVAGLLGQHVGNNKVIAVSGGSTMARVAENIFFSEPGVTVVPARGGLGERVEYQANTIAAVMAGKLGGKYRLLHIPDGMNEEALEVILAGDANARAVAEMIRQADILIHGIGQAAEMARRRGVDTWTVEQIAARGAVGEALGHYCTLQGKIVHVTNSVGLQLSDLTEIGTVIAVAGGRKKAVGFVAVSRTGGQCLLVTDEAAARAVWEIIR